MLSLSVLRHSEGVLRVSALAPSGRCEVLLFPLALRWPPVTPGDLRAAVCPADAHSFCSLRRLHLHHILGLSGVGAQLVK